MTIANSVFWVEDANFAVKIVMLNDLGLYLEICFQRFTTTNTAIGICLFAYSGADGCKKLEGVCLLLEKRVD
jgi:hypothetical protein